VSRAASPSRLDLRIDRRCHGPHSVRPGFTPASMWINAATSMDTASSGSLNSTGSCQTSDGRRVMSFEGAGSAATDQAADSVGARPVSRSVFRAASTWGQPPLTADSTTLSGSLASWITVSFTMGCWSSMSNVTFERGSAA
jgi:hypothetical protein